VFPVGAGVAEAGPAADEREEQGAKELRSGTAPHERTAQIIHGRRHD